MDEITSQHPNDALTDRHPNRYPTVSPGYTLRPIYFKEAADLIRLHHRHHLPPQGWLFGTSAISADGDLVACITIGRTTARKSHSAYTAEVTRCCVVEGLERVVCRRGKNHADSLASMLYAAAWNACRALGFTRLTTFLLKSESGVTLKALKEQGWRFVRESDGRSWSVPTRPRVDTHPLGVKQLWEVRSPEIPVQS